MGHILCVLWRFKMALLLESASKCELRSVIHFLTAKNNTATKIQRELCRVYGRVYMSLRVFKWYHIGVQSYYKAELSCMIFSPPDDLQDGRCSNIYHTPTTLPPVTSICSQSWSKLSVVNDLIRLKKFVPQLCPTIKIWTEPTTLSAYKN